MRNQKRSSNYRIAAIPHVVMDHPDFISLSPNAIRLLLEVSKQYSLKNNGKLCITWSQMKKRGYKSEATLQRAKKELLEKELIIVSKRGGFDCEGKRSPNFYALTRQAIDEIYGFEMDIAPTNKPLRAFSLKQAG